MNKSRRILGALLAVLTCLSLIPAVTLAGDSSEEILIETRETELPEAELPSSEEPAGDVEESAGPAEPIPVGAAAPTETPEPTAEPQSIETPVPTAEPVPIETPVPTAVPLPAETPAPDPIEAAPEETEAPSLDGDTDAPPPLETEEPIITPVSDPTARPDTLTTPTPTPGKATGTNADSTPTPAPTTEPATNTNADPSPLPSTIDITGAEVTLSKSTYTYSGKERKPTPTVTVNGEKLTKDTDFTVSYSDNINAGTATVTVEGTGGYSGTATAYFTINAATIKKATVTLSCNSYVYDGNAKKPTATVVLKSKTLTKDTDYSVSYKNCKKIGTATVVIKGKGNYKGTVKKTFVITTKKASEKISASNVTAVWSKKKQTVQLEVSKLGDGKLTFTSNNSSVKVGKKTGKITIAKKFVGKATITIKSAASKNYKAASKKITVTVKPAAVALKAVTNSAPGELTATWAKSAYSKTTGYQIRYSTSESFSGTVTKKTVKGVKTVEKAISGLTSGQTYYVQIRVYQTVSGKKYYSAWSDTLSCSVN